MDFEGKFFLWEQQHCGQFLPTLLSNKMVDGEIIYTY